jgi:hypothetical protein
VGPLEAIVATWSLDPAAFRAVDGTIAPSLRFGVAVALAAGLSLAVGQSVVLFTLGVRPSRFLASLALQAALFAAGFLVWTTSTWALAALAFDAPRPWAVAVAATGLAHAPQVFGAFVLVPYLGTGIGALLSVWTLLAMLVATATVFDLSAPQALLATAGGWLLVQVAQRTVGRPLARATDRLRRVVAGGDLDAPRLRGP